MIRKVLQALAFCFYFLKKKHAVGVLPTTEDFSSKLVFPALVRVLLFTVEMLLEHIIMLS